MIREDASPGGLFRDEAHRLELKESAINIQWAATMLERMFAAMAIDQGIVVDDLESDPKRAAFHKWLHEAFPGISIKSHVAISGNWEYADDRADTAWEAWQAGRSAESI